METYVISLNEKMINQTILSLVAAFVLLIREKLIALPQIGNSQNGKRVRTITLFSAKS